MKIAFVVHDVDRLGGHSRYVHELVERLKHHHEVHVFANRIRDMDDPLVRVHRVWAWRRMSLSTVLTFAMSLRFVRMTGFDIVHVQGFVGVPGNVITAHICCPEWHRALQSRAGGQARHEAVTGWILTLLERRLYEGTRKGQVIGVSRRVSEDIARWYKLRCPVSVIYHGIDLEVFNPANRARRDAVRRRLAIPPDRFVFLYVGDLRKGALESVRALASTPMAHLLLVSRSRSEACMSLAAELGLQNRVTFGGFSDRVQDIYAASDALLLPSPYDSFAMVVLEAMASGLPAVVSRQAGAAEILTHGTDGLVIKDPFDTEELATYMRDLMASPDMTTAMGRAARKTAEKFTWDAVATQTCKVYEAVMGTNSGVSP
jgi:UDP-glucose:(heptosyl)LPS alpha-1,3-glucosyltransferase